MTAGVDRTIERADASNQPHPGRWRKGVEPDPSGDTEEVGVDSWQQDVRAQTAAQWHSRLIITLPGSGELPPGLNCSSSMRFLRSKRVRGRRGGGSSS